MLSLTASPRLWLGRGVLLRPIATTAFSIPFTQTLSISSAVIWSRDGAVLVLAASPAAEVSIPNKNLAFHDRRRGGFRLVCVLRRHRARRLRGRLRGGTSSFWDAKISAHFTDSTAATNFVFAIFFFRDAFSVDVTHAPCFISFFGSLTLLRGTGL